MPDNCLDVCGDNFILFKMGFIGPGSFNQSGTTSHIRSFVSHFCLQGIHGGGWGSIQFYLNSKQMKEYEVPRI